MAAGAGYESRPALAGAGYGSGAGAGSFPETVAASPTFGSFSPDNGSIGQLIVIGLANMPASFTLNDITLNGVSLANVAKNSDSEVQGNVSPSNSTGVLEVTFNTTETVDSSGLSPSDFTVV